MTAIRLISLPVLALALAIGRSPLHAQGSEHGEADKAVAVVEAVAQETHEAVDAAGQEEHSAEGEHGSSDQIDIAHHIGNSHEIETPFGTLPLPEWEPIRIGNIALDLSPTKHTVFMAIAAVLVALTFLMSARAIRRAEQAGKPARGFAGAMEEYEKGSRLSRAVSRWEVFQVAQRRPGRSHRLHRKRGRWSSRCGHRRTDRWCRRA